MLQKLACTEVDQGDLVTCITFSELDREWDVKKGMYRSRKRSDLPRTGACREHQMNGEQ